MNNEELSQHIEALLFALGEALSREELSKMLGAGTAEIEEALAILKTRGREQRRGIIAVDDGKVVELRAAPAAAPAIERVRKEAYSRDIGRAGLEALAAVLYRGALSRAQIDFIRGVNSSQTLRTLAMRGLVRKIPNPKDERSFLYEPTTELLAELGVSQIADLPEFETIREKLRTLEEASASKEEGEAREEESGAAADANE